MSNNTILPDDFDWSNEEFNEGFIFGGNFGTFGKKYEKPQDKDNPQKKDETSKPITPVNRIRKYD